MSRFLNNKYIDLEAYTPGEQPTDMKYIKLNTNESPYPPSRETIEAISYDEGSRLNLYPDPTCGVLKEALAKRYGLNSENVFVSNGSDDILNFSFMAFAGGREKAVFPDVTYGFYEVFCKLHHVDFIKVPLCEDFTICIDDYTKNSSMVVIANPNAPTGILLSLTEIEKIVSSNFNHVVVIDEAYIDFGGESAVSLVKKYDNLLVVQTYSKSRSLAGARLGYAFGCKELILDLEKIKYSTNPYSINRLTLNAGISSINSDDYYVANCKQIIKTRDFTKKALEELGFYVTDSYANFLFAKKDGVDGGWLYKQLRKNGVLVRHFTADRIKDFNRITIGTPEHMKKLIEITKSIVNS